MQFDFFITKQVNGNLEIEDYSNVCIEACNDIYYRYYLQIKTELGFTKIIEYGPITEEAEITNYSFSYVMIEFNDKKICSTIDKFLNNSKRCITQARVLSEDEFKEKIIDYKNIVK